jgi:gluconokinase
MSRGEGLTDADRADWLEALRDHESISTPPGKPPHLVMTCSALKRKYRDVLREGSKRAGNLQIRFIFLDAPEEVLAKRAAERKGHYARADLVHSQFQDLERPGPDEEDVITVDVNRPIEETENDVLAKIEEMLQKEGKTTEGLCGKL